jgi:hypothetical protein
MTKRPRDLVDLMLAPVALAIDDRLQELAAMTGDELDRCVVWETGMLPGGRRSAQRAILDDLTSLVPTRGWELTWDVRGVRLQHRDHGLVLGVPDSLARWVASMDAVALGAV